MTIELRKLGFPEVSRRWREFRKPIDGAAGRIALSDGAVREESSRIWKMIQYGTLEVREILRGRQPIGWVVLRIDRDHGYDALEVRFLHVARGVSGWHAEVLGAIMALARDLGCRIVEGHGRRGWRKVMGELGAKVTAGFWIEV